MLSQQKSNQQQVAHPPCSAAQRPGTPPSPRCGTASRGSAATCTCGGRCKTDGIVMSQNDAQQRSGTASCGSDATLHGVYPRCLVQMLPRALLVAPAAPYCVWLGQKRNNPKLWPGRSPHGLQGLWPQQVVRGPRPHAASRKCDVLWREACAVNWVRRHTDTPCQASGRTCQPHNKA